MERCDEVLIIELLFFDFLCEGNDGVNLCGKFLLANFGEKRCSGIG